MCIFPLQYPHHQTTAATPVLPVELADCPLTLVDTPEQLQQMAATLATVDLVR